ncbi:MAG: hypothetical protein LBV17_12220 [Treponema sp.]|jgi:hypothetical protein|nr:hypothetical protein [Treponema sp.]
MAKLKSQLTVADKKKLHEEWSELVTGSKNGLEFNPGDPVFTSNAEMPATTHAYGKKGYEICVRSGVYYAVYAYFDKKDKITKEKEIPLFSRKSKSFSFPYKFKIKGEDREFTEAEFSEIESMLHSPKRRKPFSP